MKNHTKLVLEHLANDAFLISTERHKILLDSFFSKRVLPFSAMPADVMNDILEGTGKFTDVDMILATHCHADHCNAEDLLKCRLNAVIIVPEDAFSGFAERPSQKMICVGNTGVVWDDSDIKITAVKTDHDGSRTVSPKMHFSYILEFKPEEKCLLIMGDAETRPGMFDEWLDGRNVNCLIINFVEAYQEKGRNFMNSINPERALLCHLPLPEDDNTHMGKLAKRNAEKRREELPPVTVCFEPGTIIEL